MKTTAALIKNSAATLTLGTASDHFFYDNWLPEVLLDLLNNLDERKGEIDVDNLKYLEPSENVQGESAILDLDKKIITLPKGIFLIVPPEKVAEENEAYGIEKEGGEFILRNLDPAEGEEKRYVLKPVSMDYLAEKTSKVLPLGQAKEILASMLRDAESYKRPLLLENGMVYVANLD